MKILITYASAGAGHRTAALAVYDYLKNNRPDLELKLVDVLDYSGGFLRFSYTLGYNFLVRFAPLLWRFAFWLTSREYLKFIVSPIGNLVDVLSTGKFIRLLLEEQPELVVSSHFMTSSVVCRLIQEGKIKAKLITIITDYGVHPFWICKNTDHYIVASDATAQILKNTGIPSIKITAAGIPVDSKFLTHLDSSEIRKKLKLNSELFTVLIMTGSFGVGPIEKIIDSLPNDLQVIVVCATNKKLYQKLMQKSRPNLKIFGFVDNVHELMFASDVFITKPGGMSVSEVLAAGVAPIFISPIPGQEEENAKVLRSAGIVRSPKKVRQIRELVIAYQKDPQFIQTAKERILAFRKIHSLEEISDVVRRSCT